VNYEGLTVGYAPNATSLAPPGDRRRFCFFAKHRSIAFELADPTRDYDVVYLSPRADISVWSHYEGSAKVVYELVDSYLAINRRDPKAALRGLAKFAVRETKRPMISYRAGIERMARRADAVVCTTEEQKADLSEFCENVHVILDDHSEIEGTPKSSYDIGDSLNLVWEGMSQNLSGFSAIAPVLRRVSMRTPVQLHLITDLSVPRYMGRFMTRPTEDVVRDFGIPTHLYEWSADRFAELVTACDLAVIPIDLNDPFAAGKPENKLLIFWRLAMPTLTSATPAYERAMADAGMSMTCRSAVDWETTIDRFLEDHDGRAEAARRGRRYALEEHSQERLLARWDRLFESVLK